MENIKLALVILCCRDWKASFGASMIGLTRRLTLQNIQFEVNIMQGASVLPRARQLAIKWAQDIGATHLLCIDDDMQFHADVPERLLAHDLDIVACNYVSKATRDALVHGLDGKLLSSSGRTGLEEVGWAGFGMILIKVAALQNIPLPFFETTWLREKQDFIGEDFYFCRKMREHGVKIHVDHDASQLVSHIGDIAFGFPQKPRLVAEAAE